MNKLSLFAFLFLACLACTKNERCFFEKEPSPPSGFEINMISTIPFDGKLEQLQFVNDNVGFISGLKEDSDFLEIFKTEDGGATWNNLNVSQEYRSLEMMFLDENNGIISIYGNSSNVHLLRTTDGGLTWGQLIFEELDGRITKIQKDNNSNLYAIVSSIERIPALVKSIDKGLSWQIIYEFPPLSVDLLRIHEDKAYTVKTDDRIIVTDLEGNYLETINFQYTKNNTVDMTIIDEDNIVLTSFYTAIKTTDRGANWTKFYSDSSKILDFTDSKNGIMLFQKEYCEENPNKPSVLAYTDNGGIDWFEGAQVEYLFDKFKDIHKKSDNNYIMLIEKNLYKLTR